MTEKLKPCPFCGSVPQLFDIGKLVCCESLTCSGNQFPMLVRQWETRPVEDALKAEHADALRRETMAIESQHELEAEIMRLRNALEFYADVSTYQNSSPNNDDGYRVDHKADIDTDGGNIAREALEPKP